MNNEERLSNVRHSTAHLLAQAVLELFPGTKLTIGPVTDNGFFYDFLPTRNFKDEDLPIIEKKMKELSKRNLKIEGKEISKEEALEFFKGNEFKEELINGITDEKIGFFCQGDFCDLCKGGHVRYTKELKHFKLTGISGSYWRADRDGIQLQRISGIAFDSKEEMEEYFQKIEEAKANDHRKLGEQLDLFSFKEEAPGVAFFHDKGFFIFNKMIEVERELQQDLYEEVRTPMMMNEKLWRTSGHYDNYKDMMYFTKADDVPFCIKPMNCPGGILIYKNRPHSYRELPMRVAEYGFVHRHELSGVLHGLFRVRGFTQDDAHIYCTVEQVEDEIIGVLNLVLKLYKKFGFETVKMYVSTRPEKSIGAVELWDKGIEALKNALTRSDIPFEVKEGEGAFYGPKIDIDIEDSMGRSWQCGTIQIDFFLPQNFELEYIDSDQSRKTPIMIHRALYGSIERFMGILIEHCKGHFPFWMSPVQARILTITDSQTEYAETVYASLKKEKIRVEVDRGGDQIGAQIRRAQMDKIPWMLVIGKKEVENNTVTLRHTNGKQEFGLSIEEIIRRAKELDE